jgi:regulator of replication initiation timing
MPTREQQWMKAFDVFIDFIKDHHYPGLEKYDIKGLTKNKTLTRQQYEITFPKQVVAYHIDTFVADENGLVQPPGPVMKDQQVPTMICLDRYIHNYFEDYKLREGGKLISYVEVCYFQNPTSNEQWGLDELNSESAANSKTDYKVILGVVYYKSHIPFPAAIRSSQQIEQKYLEMVAINRVLTENLREMTEGLSRVSFQYESVRRRMRTEKRAIEDKYKNLFETMEKKFVSLYGEKNMEEDCPVCYEVIPADKLKVPGCGHFICSSCQPRCSGACPMCREQYLV